MSMLSVSKSKIAAAAAAFSVLSACNTTGGTPIEFPVGDGSATATITIPDHAQIYDGTVGKCDRVDVNTHVADIKRAQQNPGLITIDDIRVSGSGDITAILPGIGYETTSPGYGIAGGVGNDVKIIGDLISMTDTTGGRDHWSVILGDVGINDAGKTITVHFNLAGTDVDVSRDVVLNPVNGFVEFSASESDFGRRIEGVYIKDEDGVSLSLASVETTRIHKRSCSSDDAELPVDGIPDLGGDGNTGGQPPEEEPPEEEPPEEEPPEEEPPKEEPPKEEPPKEEPPKEEPPAKPGLGGGANAFLLHDFLNADPLAAEENGIVIAYDDGGEPQIFTTAPELNAA